jgi:hypothetical protein
VRFRGWWTGLLALAGTGLSATACLPAGDPPMGRQVIVGRDDLPAGLLPASPDGIVRLLVLRLDRERFSSDLYLVSVDGAAPPTERLLAENLGWSNGCFDNRCFPADRRGRVFVSHDYDAGTSTGKVTRIDAVSGEQLELGDVDVNTLQLSPSGDRLAAFSYATPGEVAVYESDDRATVLAGTMSAKFVGEDFYYVAADKRLMRLPASGGEPELVRAGVSAFEAQETLAGTLLILFALTPDLTVGTVTIFDPVTLQEMFRPVELSMSVSVSPDRRWLLITDNTSLHYTLVDAMTGGEERFDAPAGAGWASVEWRPGHAELWLQFYRDTLEQPPFDGWIKEPGLPPRVVPLYLRFVTEAAVRPRSFFTRDGSYVFSLRLARSGPPAVQVGSADDPTGPRFDITAEGSFLVGYWLVADGRLVTAAAYSPSSQRNEIRVIDLARGESRSLALESAVVTIGQRRVLATAHVTDGFGDLRVLDLDSGASTLFGIEFVGMAFSEPREPGPELVTPGSHVAFQFQGRFASPYDGFWVATVP